MIEMVDRSAWILIVFIPAALAAWFMGQAIGATWRPYWQLVLYSVMLGCVDRFMIYALFLGSASWSIARSCSALPRRRSASPWCTKW